MRKIEGCCWRMAAGAAAAGQQHQAQATCKAGRSGGGGDVRLNTRAVASRDRRKPQCKP